MPVPAVIIWGAYVLGSAAVSAVVNRVRKTKLKIAVLGPEEGGKTTFIELLKKGHVDATSYKMTDISAPIPEFEAYWTKNNKWKRTDIAINTDNKFWEKVKDCIPGQHHGGKDIPGDQAMMTEYKNLLKNKDFSFFFFNIKRYFDDEKYKKDVNRRFDFTNDYLKPQGLIVVATHIDLIEEGINEISSRFREIVKEKTYVEMLKNVKYVNLLDSNAGDEMRKCLGKDGEN